MTSTDTGSGIATSAKMPTFFVPHGAGPCFFMEWNPRDAWDRTAAFLGSIAGSLPQSPQAIVVITGHWQEDHYTVSSHPRPGLIYDYYGFPAHTYELQYPAPGHPELASHIAELINEAGLPVAQDANRGFDHGTFIPLKVMFPNADIPVVQLSLRKDLSARGHLAVGEALRPLRDQGVLIVGSGMSFHNMRGYGDPKFGPISDEFDRWLTHAISLPASERSAALADWESAPGARLSHPPRAEEHLLPLFVAAGAAGDDLGEQVFSDRVMEVTLSAYRFGTV